MFNKISSSRLNLESVFKKFAKIRSHTPVLEKVRKEDTQQALLELEQRYYDLETDYNTIISDDAKKFLDKAAAEQLYNNNFVNFKEKIGNNKVKTLQKAIRDAALELNDRCPICGNPVANVIDHVLPKSIYPDLAVTPINMVPMCEHCNHAKDDKDYGFHPYFEDLSDLSDLCINIDFSNFSNGIPAINLSFQNPSNTKLQTYFYEYDVAGVALSNAQIALEGQIRRMQVENSGTNPFTEEEVSSDLKIAAMATPKIQNLEKKLFTTLYTDYLQEFTEFLNL